MLFFWSFSALLINLCLAQGLGQRSMIVARDSNSSSSSSSTITPQTTTTTAQQQQPTTGMIPKFYNSTFRNPIPPLIQTEFRANYMQHKFDVNVNHITTGFMYISPSQQKIRADAADDGSLEISMFDFRNTTANGTLVANTLLSFVGGAVDPVCSSFFVPPFIELFPADFLRQTNAVFAGVQHDDLYGPVNAWTFHQGADLQVTFFLQDANDLVLRFDFSSSNELRTFATTRFFNIIPGPVNATVFESSCR